MPVANASPTVIQKLNYSRSTPGAAPYTTKLDTATGVAWCSCLGWKTSKKAPKACRHTDEFLAEWQAGGGRVTAAPTPTPAPAPAVAFVTPADKPLRPMLAQAMTKGQSVASFCTPAWVLQLKEDGHRKSVRKTGAAVVCHSRPGAGKEPLPFPLDADFVAAFRLLPDGVYDGELLIPVTTSFRATRREFVLFDVVELLGQSVRSKPHHERRQLLEVALAHYTKTLDADATPLLTLVGEMPATIENIDRLFAQVDRPGRTGNEEGGILRRVASPYRDGYRSPDWLKLKRRGHETVTITGFERGKADSSTPWSVTLFKRDNGLVGKCSTKDTATVEQVRKNPAAFIDKRLVIQYVELEPSGAFRSGGWDHLAGEGE